MKVQSRKSAAFHTETKKESSHPLHLFINNTDAKILGVPAGGTCCFLSLSAKRSTEHDTNGSLGSHPQTPSSDSQHNSDQMPSLQCSSSCSYEHHTELTNLCCNSEWINIACCVWIRDDGDISSSETRSITSAGSSPQDDFVIISGTADFLLHYQIDVDDELYVKTMNIYPLTKVVIGVYNFHTYQWLQNLHHSSKSKFSPFCTGVLLEVCKHPIMARENDIFLAPYPEMFTVDGESGFEQTFFQDMHVLECCPLRVGTITTNTEIILSFLNEEVNSQQKPFYLESPVKAMTSKSLDQYLISDFSQPLSLRPDALALNAKTIGIARRSVERRKPMFNYQVLQQSILWRRFLVKPQINVTFDPLYYIGMTKNTMLQYGFFEESLVKVSLDGQCRPLSIPVRLCLIKCITESVENTDKVFISPMLLFNLQMTLSKPHTTSYVGPIKIEVI